MNKESFLDTIRNSLLADIREAYLECEHGPDKPVDYEKLGRIMARLLASAKRAGLSASEVEEIANVTMPGLTSNIAPFRKAA